MFHVRTSSTSPVVLVKSEKSLKRAVNDQDQFHSLPKDGVVQQFMMDEFVFNVYR